MALDDGSRADLEMQRRIPANLAARLAYYGTRDFSAQLVRGDDYEDLTPTSVIAWLGQPMFRDLRRLHALKLYRNELAVTLAKGEAKGRKEARVEFLLELLGARFGRLSSATRARVEAAPSAQLAAWGRRVLTARTLEEVFAR